MSMIRSTLSSIAVATLLVTTAPCQHPEQAVEASQKAERAPRPVDFAAVDRTLGKLPVLNAKQPLYALFLFGPHAETRVWAVLDASAAGVKGHDRLYLDLDGDQDLTEAGECIDAKSLDDESATFELARWRDPATGAVHTNVQVGWGPKRMTYRMNWRGEDVTMGCYGPDADSYGQFGDSPKSAPILVPGWDRPLEFERWFSGTLTRGKPTDFKVFIGNRGGGTGEFTCVEDDFLPADEHPVATLIYTDTAGNEREIRSALTDRC